MKKNATTTNAPQHDAKLPVSSQSLVDKHQMCIEILEGIMNFEQRKKHRIESIDGFAGTFPELRRKYLNDIDTIDRCIKRLEQRYHRVLHGTKPVSADGSTYNDKTSKQ